jgi:hypothetical protein
MQTRILLSILCVLLILPSGVALAAIVINAGDIGASYPDVMVHDRKGFFMPRSEAYVFSNTAIPYPEDLVGASSLQVSLYFITETVTSGNVRMRCWLDSYNTGDPFNVGGYMDDSPAVPVAGGNTIIYKQVFTFETIPPERELFAFAVSRYTTSGDTYQDGIYLHAIRFEVTTVDIYDVKGRLVQTLLANEVLDAGPQDILWAEDGLASGTYVVRVETAGLVETIKVALIK